MATSASKTSFRYHSDDPGLAKITTVHTILFLEGPCNERGFYLPGEYTFFSGLQQLRVRGELLVGSQCLKYRQHNLVQVQHAAAQIGRCHCRRRCSSRGRYHSGSLRGRAIIPDAAGCYKAVQLSDPEDEAESLERPKLNFAVSVVAGGSDVVERMMESRRRLQNGVRARPLSWWMRWMPASVGPAVARRC